MATRDGRTETTGHANHYVVPATAETVHWGYFSQALKPVLSVESGDFVTIETLTHHAYDDHARMIEGDPGAQSVFLWTKNAKNVDRRGAGPMDATIYGRGAGEGLGVHICTGPVFVRDAQPGDVLEVRILDVKLRGCSNPAFSGRAFGSNAAALWGFHYNDLLTEPKPREVNTIYELDATGPGSWARAVYNYGDVLSRCGAGRAVVGRRSACEPGGCGTLRHRHRMLPDRNFPADRAQAGIGLPQPRSRTCAIRCSRPPTNGSCTASASRTTWPGSATRHRAKFFANPHSISRCGMRDAGCGMRSGRCGTF
jgi:hypothetical protein